MKRRTFAVPAGPNARAVLADAIRCFAHAAYPPGGSDCAQVSRETLFTTAKAFDSDTDVPQVSTRHRVLLRQAVQWYCANIETLADDRRDRLAEGLLQLLKGEPVDDALFDADTHRR